MAGRAGRREQKTDGLYSERSKYITPGEERLAKGLSHQCYHMMVAESMISTGAGSTFGGGFTLLSPLKCDCIHPENWENFGFISSGSLS